MKIMRLIKLILKFLVLATKPLKTKKPLQLKPKIVKIYNLLK